MLNGIPTVKLILWHFGKKWCQSGCISLHYLIMLKV